MLIVSTIHRAARSGTGLSASFFFDKRHAKASRLHAAGSFKIHLPIRSERLKNQVCKVLQKRNVRRTASFGGTGHGNAQDVFDPLFGFVG